MSNLRYIFVHGLSGWGSYDEKYKNTPYWGMRSGDLNQIGSYSGTTKGGTVIDASWHENDGLVNTISAKAPFGHPQRKLNRKNIQPGVWNIFPVYHGDHMMIHGGLTRKTDVKKFYVNLLSMIDAL